MIRHKQNVFPQDDDFSPMTWDRLPEETDEDYEDRMQDQQDLMEFYDG